MSSRAAAFARAFRQTAAGCRRLLTLSRGADAWVALVACLAVTGGATFDALRRETATARIQFNSRVRAIEQGLAERMNSFVQVLRGASGLLAANPSLDASQWRAYYEAIDLSPSLNSLQALGFIESVGRTNGDRYPATSHQTGSVGSGIQDYPIWPISDRENHYVVTFVEPLSRNRAALGYDIGTESLRREAAEEARDTGEATLTGRISLVQAPGKSAVLLLLPVYRSGNCPTDLAQRRHLLRGWVYVAFLLEDLVGGLSRLGRDEVGFDLYDGTVRSQSSLLYREPSPAGLPARTLPAKAPLSLDTTLVTGARTWALHFTARPAFGRHAGYALPECVAAGGVFISFLVFGMVQSLSTSERRALALAKQMHKNAQEKLAKAHKRYQELVDNLAVGVFRSRAGEQGRFIEANPALVTMCEADSKAELLQHSVSEFYVNPLQRNEFSESLLRDGTVRSRELELRTMKNRPFWGAVSATKVLDEDGEVVFDGVIEDITQRKEVEQALRESQERFALAVQGTNDGIWDWNVVTNEVYFSPRWKAMLGYDEGEVENTFSGWARLLHPADRERSLAAIEAYFSGMTPTYELEHRLLHKDGSYRWILSRGIAVRDSEGRPLRMTGSHLDLTDRKLAEVQLRQANADLAGSQVSLNAALRSLRLSHEQLKATQLQLIQAAKLESVGTLAAGVAHEVKNPLQTILWGMDYLEDILPSPNNTLKTVVSDMRDAARRANAIVKELLQFSAVTGLEMHDTDLNGLVEHSLRLVRYEAEAAGIRVLRDLAPDLPPVPLDPGKMEQAFINILLNAIQAMSHHGTLTVRTRARENPEAPPSLDGGAPEAPEIVAEFLDTGPGIPDEHLQRIFDPFFTTKAVGLGTGLGLPVVKKIAELHNAGLDVANIKGGGICVRFTFAGRRPMGPMNAENGSPQEVLTTQTNHEACPQT